MVSLTTSALATGRMILSEVAIALQQTRVEHGVSAQLRWEVELVVQVSYFLHHCLWPNESWQQLASTWERSYEIVRKVLNA